MPTPLALALFAVVALLITLAASRVFCLVQWRIVALLIAAVCAYVLLVPATHAGPPLHAARTQLVAGELPLWSGQPLLANPRLALAHPFVLMATLADSIELTAALRLFAMLFFGFVLFRAWDVGDGAALFGAIAYTFSTTSLLSSSALTMAALPLALAAAQEHARLPRARTFATLTIALALVALGGDVGTAIRVGVVTAAYAIFLSRQRRMLVTVAAAIALAAGLTAFFWMPLLDIAPHIAKSDTPRDWLQFLALVAPNVLGTTSVGYAGILTLFLAAIGIVRSERREKWFFLTVALLGFWPLGLAALGALGLCAVARGIVDMRTFCVAIGCAAFALLTVWLARAEYLDETFAWTQALIPFIALALFALVTAERRIIPAVVAAALTFAELTFVAQQANLQPVRFENARYARLQAEAPESLAALAKMPPAFVVRHYAVQAEIPDVIPRLKRIPDFRNEAIVHDVPPSIASDAPQLARSGISAPRDVRVRAIRGRERELDVSAASGWSLLLTHDVDWPGWRGYWNGHRLPVVTVDGAFAGAFVPPERGTLVLRYWPAPFADGLRVSAISLLIGIGAATGLVGRRRRRTLVSS
jgi:hypothetical protein